MMKTVLAIAASTLVLGISLGFPLAAPAKARPAPLNIAPLPRVGAPGHVTPEKSSAALMRAGDEAMQEKQYNSAIAFYRQAAQLAPKSTGPLRAMAGALSAAGAAPDAFGAWRQVLQREPGDWQANVELGKLAIRLARPTEAIAFLETARTVRDDASVEGALGVARDSMGDHVAAQASYRAGLALAPTSGPLRNDLGLSLALAGKYPEAIAVLSALAADPTASPRNRLNLALVYGLAGDDAKAAAAARRDLGEKDNAANQNYYRMLRGLDDKARTQAVLAGQIG